MGPQHRSSMSLGFLDDKVPYDPRCACAQDFRRLYTAVQRAVLRLWQSVGNDMEIDVRVELVYRVHKICKI